MSRLIIGRNDLNTICIQNGELDIIASWDTEKNMPLTPKDVTYRSGNKAWWRCSECGFSWEAKIASRTYGHGCPVCGRRRALEKGHNKKVINNNFKEKFPEYAKEWNYERNNGLGPEDFSCSSKTKVWWKCCECGHEWIQSLNSRTGNRTKCPVCNRSGRVIKGINDFATLYPQYVSEWDHEKNEKEPCEYSISSKTSVWWKCSKGHSWKSEIASRTRTLDSKCPVCTNRLLLIGYNDLETLFPELAKEWDFSLNDDVPRHFKINDNIKVAWICSKCGNHFTQRIYDRTIHKTGCPVCGQEKSRLGFQKSIVLQRGSLAEKCPELLAEWDYEKNSGLRPEQVSAGSKRKVWWRCKYGHSFYSIILNRRNGAGCPVCNLKSTTSFPEQCVYFYVKKVFPEAENGYKLDKKVFDVFIPSLNVAIEYDGYKWHQDERDTNNDVVKNQICINHGITLFRIREEGSASIPSEGIIVISCKYKNDCSLENAITKLFDYLGQNANVSIERDRIDIQNQYYSAQDKQSLLEKFPHIAKEWDYEKNSPIRPDMVHYGTNIKYWWKCAKGHEWKSNVCSRTKIGTGCPFCNGNRVLRGYNDLKTVYPELIAEWDFERNKDVEISEISSRSNKSVWWKCCECGHEWKTKVVRRVEGNGCPICLKKQKKDQNLIEINIDGIIKKAVPDSLWEVDKELLAQWNYQKNLDLNPWEIKATSTEKVWWICENGHTWKTQIWSRYKRRTGCPYCNNKMILAGYNDLESCKPEVAKEWNYEKNLLLTPAQVTCGSNRSVWWKCAICGYEWTSKICRRTSGTKCPKCHGGA